MATRINCVVIEGRIAMMAKGTARHALAVTRLTKAFDMGGGVETAVELPEDTQVVPLSRLERTKHGRAMIDAYLDANRNAAS